MAYTIDGDLDDWGVNLSAGLGSDESAWVPSSLTADWIVEDNIDGEAYPGYTDWTGYSATGVHIKGHGALYDNYEEPKIIAYNGGEYISPSGGEHYDIEAMYFDSDASYAYFAIVTSYSEYGMGDLAIDIVGDKYGIVLQDDEPGTSKGQIYHNPTWKQVDPNQFPANGPYRITGGTLNGIGSVAYVNSGIPDYSYSNYIIEISAPRTALGSPSNGQLSDLHTTIWCGNDVIDLKEVTWEEIPEFTTIAIPVGMIFGLFYFYRRKRQSREEKAK
jgi:hypothetical protein